MSDAYRSAGYGLGHRVATLLENRPEYILHKFALNAIGVCCVPINPDYRAGEAAYLLEHSEPDLVLTLTSRAGQVRDALAQSRHKPPVLALEEFASETMVKPTRPAQSGKATPETQPASSIRRAPPGGPKGCILSHGYEVSCGARYAELGGAATLRRGEERIYNPLPLYHANAAVVSLMGAICTGNCQIQPERFHPQHWWREIAASRASVVHYLGIIAPLLLAQPAHEDDRAHGVRFGLGAGVEPQLHAAFEERFGFPLMELWGMTEMVRVLGDSHRAAPGRHARVRTCVSGPRGARRR